MMYPHMEPTIDHAQLEALAKASSCTVDAVVSLYEQACSSLSANARITGFIPVLAINRVREQLQVSAARQRTH